MAIKGPIGLSKIASVIFPCDTSSTERVEPQEGQAIPVTLLKIQAE